MFERNYTLEVFMKNQIHNGFAHLLMFWSKLFEIAVFEQVCVCGFGTPSSGDPPVLPLFVRLLNVFGH